MTNETDRLSDLEAFWAAKEVQLYTTMPGEIVSYDADNRRASVVLGIQMGVRGDDGEVTAKDRPIIHHAPVVFPSGGGFDLRWPLEKGDKVMVHFSMRCMDDWLDTGRRLPPRFPWKHDINDAIVVPGLTPFSEASSGPSDEMVLEHESGIKIRLTAAGKVAIEKGGVELLDLVEQLMTQTTLLADSKVATLLGPQVLSNGVAVSQAINLAGAGLKALLGQLKE